MSRWLLTLMGACLSAPALAAPCAAAVPPAPSSEVAAARLTASVRAEVLANAAAALSAHYVDAEAGRLAAEALRARARAGAYDEVDSPSQLAAVVTGDLRKAHDDLHLTLLYTPPAAGKGGGAPFDLFAGVRQRNFGLARAEVLDGNVGYLEITMFGGAEGYADAVVDALRFLARTDAVILDVRRNGGGSGEMSHFLFSHFFGPSPVPTIRVRSRGSAEPSVSHSLAEVPGPRRPDVPLFVLTSQGTGSAAEEFSFVLKNRRRATLVGTRTAGAGRMVGFFPAGHGFSLGVSITQVADPETGLEWERVGVQPDVPVPAELALAEAHAAALRRIIDGTADPGRTRILKRVLEAVDARRRPHPIDVPGMARFAGTYAGRSVSLQGGRLSYARNTGALCEELTPLGGGRFALGATQYRFEERDGRATLVVEAPDGTVARFPRDGAKEAE